MEIKATDFTFQYVSINTLRDVLEENKVPSLHSNMFLLIPAKMLQQIKEYSTLHSNMFLLIRY